MSEVFGIARWPGCTDFVSCSYTCSHGVQPGVVSLVVGETQLANMATYGDLTITDGVRGLLILRDCKRSDIQYQGIGADGGRTFAVSILDRRWKWIHGSIDGNWNRRDDQGKIIEEQQLEVREMAKLCLVAMGENPDGVGDLPEPTHEDRPEVDWVAVNPAQALSELADLFGCRVVFRPFTNDVIIRKTGEGNPLPDLPCTSFTPSQDFPEKPSKLTVVGGPIAYTVALALEAVGMEPDGTIKPIDELSYAPEGGWSAGTSPPPYFRNLTIPEEAANPLGGFGLFLPGVKVATLTRAEYEALAKSCIFKWYRPVLVALDGEQAWSAPGLEGRDLDSISYLRLLQGIATTHRDPEGNVRLDPARIVGVYNEGAANYWTNTAKDRVITEGFQIDSEKGLVKFDKYMFRLAAAGAAVAAQIAGGAVTAELDAWKVGPAELVLITSVNVRDTTNWQFEHAKRSRDIGVRGFTKERIIRRDELVYVQYASYDPNSWKATYTEDNNDAFNTAADYYIDAAEREYEDVVSGYKKYPGVLPIELDGAISQVTWEVGGGSPCFTTVSRNSEHAHWLPSYKQQRGSAKVKLIVDTWGMPTAGFHGLVRQAAAEGRK